MRTNPMLYEINALSWLFELGEKYGRRMNIGEVPGQEWDRLAGWGFDLVWLMGVWQRSGEGIRIFRSGPDFERFGDQFGSALPGWTDDDLTGSPYSIAAYSPDPRIGCWDDIRKARSELNGRGMGLILDFVPNHTAPDHPWTLSHPEYYITGGSGDYHRDPSAFTRSEDGGDVTFFARGRDPNFPPWTDTLQLNHYNPAARKALLGELRTISRYCDGVRCDMAMLVLNDIFRSTWGHALGESALTPPDTEFWGDARAALPGFVMMAEAYWDTEWRLQQLGFDYVYDKTLYDRLKGRSPDAVHLHLLADQAYQGRLVRFIENHDEQRSALLFGDGYAMACAVLLCTLPGMRLIQHGQMEGSRIRLPLQLRRARREEPDAQVALFYEKLFGIASQAAFREGRWELKDALSVVDDTRSDLIAYTYSHEGLLKLVVVNLNPYISQGRVVLSNEVSAGFEYLLRDELNDREYVRSGRDMATRGLHVVLGGYKSHVFDVSARKA